MKHVQKHHHLPFTALAILFCTQIGQAGIASATSGNEIISRIFNRIVATAEIHEGYPWPPRLVVVNEPEPNAYATFLENPNVKDSIEPVVIVTRSLFDLVSPDQEDYYAYVLGHELAHHVLGHLLRDRRGPRVYENAHSREAEFAADSLGMRYAVQAGYSISRVRSGILKFIDAGMEQPKYWAGGSTHPSWRDRLAELDVANKDLWRSIGGFENGVALLELEQYSAAERCFRGVISDFPNAWEAWSNLGYALLMQYCDGLNEEDVRHLDIGQIVTGGYYRRASSLEHQVRGSDEDQWWEAVNALTEAIRLSPSSLVARSTLGLAYLVQPGGKDVNKASKYLLGAATEADESPDVDPYVRAVILANAAVLQMEEHPKLAMAEFDHIEKLEADVRKIQPYFHYSTAIRASLSYNRAALLTRDAGANSMKEIADLLEEYLRDAPKSPWWGLAYERYTKAMQRLGKRPLRAENLKKVKEGVLRPVTTLIMDSGKTITISENTADVQRRFPGMISVPLTGSTKMMLLVDEKYGMKVLVSDQVLAIYLNGENAPKVTLKGIGLGAETTTIRIGMEKESLERLLQKHDFVFRELFTKGHLFRIYNDLGLALRIEEGALATIVLISPTNL